MGLPTWGRIPFRQPFRGRWHRHYSDGHENSSSRSRRGEGTLLGVDGSRSVIRAGWDDGLGHGRETICGRPPADSGNRQYPNEPALTDYPWHPDGFEVSEWPGVAKAPAFAIGFTVFLSMFNWWAFVARGPWMVKGIVILFDCVALDVVGRQPGKWGVPSSSAIRGSSSPVFPTG